MLRANKTKHHSKAPSRAMQRRQGDLNSQSITGAGGSEGGGGGGEGGLVLKQVAVSVQCCTAFKHRSVGSRTD